MINERIREILIHKLTYLSREKARIEQDSVVGTSRSYMHYDKMLEWAIRDIQNKLNADENTMIL